MPITHRQGKKSQDDIKTSFGCPTCGYFEDITFKELAYIIVELCKNEDRLYPPEAGLRGGQMLIDYFQSCYNAGQVLEGDIKNYR